MSELNKSNLVLVYAANGVQGGAVALEAMRRGHRVRALVRDSGKSEGLVRAGIDVAAADLSDLDALVRAHAGVTTIVLQLPLGPIGIMESHTANALRAAELAGVASIILKLSSASRAAPCTEPSFVSNALVEAMVRASGQPVAVVRPTMYLDNLLKPGVRAQIAQHGVFEVPIAASQKIAWTSAADCAAAAITLIENGSYGGDHLISGPQSLTGDQLVAAVSAGLGRPVAFRSEEVAHFERDVEAAMGNGTGKRVASKFRFFLANGREADAMLAPVFASQPGLEGFRPRSVEQWTLEHRSDFHMA